MDRDRYVSLAQVVRTKLTAGSLAPLRSKVAWAGNGSGKACGVCGKPVSGSEVEYEVEQGGRRATGCHFACFVVWKEESRSFDGAAATDS